MNEYKIKNIKNKAPTCRRGVVILAKAAKARTLLLLLLLIIIRVLAEAKAAAERHYRNT